MLIVGAKYLQQFLVDLGEDIVVDGIIGPKTMAAVNVAISHYVRKGWSKERRLIAAQQLLISRSGIDVGFIDGLVGPNTRYALECWQNAQRDKKVPWPVPKNPWPRERDAESFFGSPGVNLERMKLPYKMKLAWDLSTSVTSFYINRECADSAHNVLERVLEIYGLDEIERLGLNIYSGCFSNRAKRGGTTKSMHAYGAAIDFDDTHNQLRMHAPQARFSGEAYIPWWEAWEDEGWVSLGRERNYDWMHVQAAVL